MDEEFGGIDAVLEMDPDLQAYLDEIRPKSYLDDLCMVVMLGASVAFLLVLANTVALMLSHGQIGVHYMPVARLDGQYSGFGVIVQTMGHECSAFLNVWLPELQRGCRS